MVARTLKRAFYYLIAATGVGLGLAALFLLTQTVQKSGDFDRMQDLSKITVPALIVAGTNDMLTPPKYAEHMAANIPNNELHVIEGAGHMLVAERAKQIAVWIEGFIERTVGQ